MMGILLTSEEVMERYAKYNLKPLDVYKNQRVKIRTLCTCGEIFLSHPSRVFWGRTVKCQKCSPRSFTGSKHPGWNGYEEISGHIWSHIKSGATKRSMDFNVEIEYAYELFIKQNRKCILSGADIGFGHEYKGVETTASLDRIDSLGEYENCNVQWVHKKINIMKWDLPQADFIKWCKLVCKNQK